MHSLDSQMTEYVWRSCASCSGSGFCSLSPVFPLRIVSAIARVPRSIDCDTVFISLRLMVKSRGEELKLGSHRQYERRIDVKSRGEDLKLTAHKHERAIQTDHTTHRPQTNPHTARELQRRQNLGHGRAHGTPGQHDQRDPHVPPGDVPVAIKSLLLVPAVQPLVPQLPRAAHQVPLLPWQPRTQQELAGV